MSGRNIKKSMEKFKKLLAYLGILAVAIIIIYAIVYYAGLSIYQEDYVDDEVRDLVVSGVIVDVSNNSMSLRDFTEVNWQFSVNDETEWEKMEPTSRILESNGTDQIETGVNAGVSYREENGEYIAEKISVYPAVFIYGDVTSVGESSLDLSTPLGDYVVNVSDETVITRVIEGGSIIHGVKLSEIKSGDRLDIVSDYEADSDELAFTAANIMIINY